MSRHLWIGCEQPAFESGQHIGTCGQWILVPIAPDPDHAAHMQGWQVNPDRCPFHNPNRVRRHV